VVRSDDLAHSRQNDGDRELRPAADWFAENLGPEVPISPRFTRFQNARKPRLPKPPKGAKPLKGLYYVYTGNVRRRAEAHGARTAEISSSNAIGTS
jgi:hypothetical protein